MFSLFTFLFHTFPLILAWLYLLVAVFFVVMHIIRIIKNTKSTFSQWLFSILNTGYALFFFITRIFFSAFWEDVFSIIGLLMVIVSFIWTRYEDRRTGRRWWYW